jgi:RNA polymerase sigma-70 factor (ECF subfamily)
MREKEKTFLDVYESNKDRIYRICHYYVSREDLVHDLFQEIFTNVWKNLDNFRGEASVNTWIYRIAINTSINFTRLLKRESRNRLFNEDSRHHNPVDQDDPGDEIEAKIRLLHRSIEQLSVAERTIISLVIEDLSYREISEICSITEGALRVRIHRIKKKLKLILKTNLNGF